MNVKTRSRRSTRSGARPRHKILVVDDHPIVRHGLRRLIDEQRDLAVCGEAESFTTPKRQFANSSLI